MSGDHPLTPRSFARALEEREHQYVPLDQRDFWRAAWRPLALTLVVACMGGSLGCGSRVRGEETPGTARPSDGPALGAKPNGPRADAAPDRRDRPSPSSAAAHEVGSGGVDGGFEVSDADSSEPPATGLPETNGLSTSAEAEAGVVPMGEWSVPRTEASPPSTPDSCSWGLAQWFSEVGVDLGTYEDCGTADPQAPAEAAACFARYRDQGALVTFLECSECRTSRTYVSVQGKAYDVYVDDGASSVDWREVTIERCDKGLVGVGICQGPALVLDCAEGHPSLRELSDPAVLANPEQIEATIASAQSDAEAAGLEAIGRRKATTTPPAACLQSLESLLNDCDPADATTWGVDCDADGTPGYFARECDPELVDAQTYSLQRDCDDGNSDLQVWAIEDADSDGYGSSVGGDMFCGPQQLPTGYVAVAAGTDCEDTNADVHPGAIDHWGDGLDTNCDSTDTPACSALASGDEIDVVAVPNSACADAVDLYVETPVDCSGCDQHGPQYVVVGNRGGVAFTGSVQLTWTGVGGTSGQVELPASLAPGEMTNVIEITQGATDYSLSTENDAPFHDCDDTNQTQQVQLRVCLR
ncbi:MAG TPA: hypothetical protein VHM70_20330 [Polyangiaceae bacterium]|jgi:hypothetical protein|nr:hypothetical protein [Polyangiaceae bacterium]